MTQSTLHPELIFGLVGPLGVDMNAVATKLESALTAVGYTAHPIQLTSYMTAVDVGIALTETTDPITRYSERIDYANAVREKALDDAALAALAILRIREIREETNLAAGKAAPANESLADLPLERHAYVIRQFKRREEIELMRRVYGRKFVQISANLAANERVLSLSRKIGTQRPELDEDACRLEAKNLIERDLNEQSKLHGQRVGQVFHLGDVFVDAKTEATIETTTRRFIEAFFGKNSLSPNPDEYGTYMAASASLRSLDTSRQVGAAIFTDHSEIVSLGSNEVPKFGGGTYWSDDATPHRDFDEGHDANTTNKRRILFDIVKRLRKSGYLDQTKTETELFGEISKDSHIDDALVMDITEFGRMTHAEMNAITDAARLGRPTKDATLFCTTFPCHNCAKHIVAAGIKRVVYIEPYPKSKALDLHYDAVTLNPEDKGKVIFEHFHGVSPRRYRDIFEKQKRRKDDGTLKEWYEGIAAPRVEDRSPYHVFNEPSALLSALRGVAKELGLVDEDSADIAEASNDP